MSTGPTRLGLPEARFPLLPAPAGRGVPESEGGSREAAVPEAGLARCPACRLHLRGELAEAPRCVRCGAELSLVRAVVTSARALQAEARRALAADDPVTAAERAWAARARVDDPSTRATLVAALALLRRRAVRHAASS